ncbi:tRNA (adenosine(37)-N6)-threonylcarbamoyltransferase complex dimerization subunit type 1 TsaB [Limisalsivibrio acetivorans]|uniref:tRNA (adenosine(37)-N6)-threonylcarbamoyltransferase complex dimerization subunit type 1 TsaB n=1 Tax=Limisalsivibrio acetivorans TaxID=1304888 RepID=UPI0003B36A64|nr:tRNA (adenosine(37)-N6)-threonylcarbamoyltransferase complex dimerization subunit type 1 TsaB [Limisalsivibrio acetivorans]
MKSLLVDTSGDRLSVSLGIRGERVDSGISVAADSSINENLLKSIDYLLSSSSTTLDGIESFYVVTGPGSFTGIRIGVSTVLGLAAGLGKVPMGISSLDAYALLKGEGSFVVYAKLRGKNCLRKSYDFDNNEFSGYEQVKLEDESEAEHRVNWNQKSTVNLSEALASPLFENFLTEYAPLYFRKSEAEINFDKRRSLQGSGTSL